MAYVIAFAIMMPISVVILIISMIISSSIGGGIDFGEARTVILKSAVLLVIVNLISLIPYGGWIALRVVRGLEGSVRPGLLGVPDPGCC